MGEFFVPNFYFVLSLLNYSVIRLCTLDIQLSHFFKRVARGEDNAVFAELVEIVFDLDRRGDELVDGVGLGLFIAFQYGALVEYFAEHFNAFFGEVYFGDIALVTAETWVAEEVLHGLDVVFFQPLIFGDGRIFFLAEFFCNA